MTSATIDIMTVKFECTLDKSTGKLNVVNQSDGILPPAVAVIALLNVSGIITHIISKIYAAIVQGEMSKEEEKKPGDDAESSGEAETKEVPVAVAVKGENDHDA